MEIVDVTDNTASVTCTTEENKSPKAYRVGDVKGPLTIATAKLPEILGTDGVKPFMDVCREEKKGIFVLVKTSNPSSGEFQDRIIEGRPLYEWVGEKVAQWGDELMGDGYSYVGAVVGATYPEMGKGKADCKRLGR